MRAMIKMEEGLSTNIKKGSIISAIGGLLILICGLYILIYGLLMSLSFGFFYLFLVAVNLFLGVMIMICAWYMHKGKKEAYRGGTIVFYSSVVSLFFGGGLLISAILGIVGGYMGMKDTLETKKRQKTMTTATPTKKTIAIDILAWGVGMAAISGLLIFFGAVFYADTMNKVIAAQVIAALTIFNMLLGMAIMVFAWLMWKGGKISMESGVAVIICSILSLLTIGGGWFVGSILGIIGGLLGIVSSVEMTETTPAISDGTKIKEDIPTQIEKLGDLKNKGLITEQEFESKKKELLSRL